jgi:hypothetical protein
VIADEDFDDMFDRRLRVLGGKDASATEYVAFLPISTAEDYVRFIDHVLKSEGQ